MEYLFLQHVTNSQDKWTRFTRSFLKNDLNRHEKSQRSQHLTGYDELLTEAGLVGQLEISSTATEQYEQGCASLCFQSKQFVSCHNFIIGFIKLLRGNDNRSTTIQVPECCFITVLRYLYLKIVVIIALPQQQLSQFIFIFCLFLCGYLCTAT